tara:strand:+ start:353 stop:658 length:306 start_codon:yes stop_codon:yes gene_type:complete
MLPVLLFNVISGLVMDKAQDCAKEHVEKMINDIIPKDAKKELDALIKDDASHGFKSAKEALLGAAEGKLPIIKADGKQLPLEINIKLKIDPDTKKIEVLQL